MRYHVLFLALSGVSGFLFGCSRESEEVVCEDYGRVGLEPSLWEELRPQGSSPSGRREHAFAYEAVSDRLFVFGGRGPEGEVLADAWVLEHASGLTEKPAWRRIQAMGAPKRVLAALGYAYKTDTLLVLGGSDETGAIRMELWALSPALADSPTWTPIEVSGTPPSPRVAAAFSYDQDTDTFILFGGNACAGSTCHLYDDTFLLRHASTAPKWEQVVLAGEAPARRAYAAAAYDPTTDRFYIYGGNKSTSSTISYSMALADLWVLENAVHQSHSAPAWKRIGVAGNAPALTAPCLVADSKSGRLVLFGGVTTAGTLGFDTYVFSGLREKDALGPALAFYPTGWPKPLGRFLHACVFATSANRMIVMGGDVGDLVVGDVWALKNASGIPLEPIGSVTILAAATRLCPGTKMQLAGEARSQAGEVLEGVLFAWGSSDPAVATVDPSGLLRAIAPGKATITGSAGGKSATLDVTVEWPQGKSQSTSLSGTWVGTFTLEDHDTGIYECRYTTGGKIVLRLSQEGSRVKGQVTLADLIDSVVGEDPAMCPPIPHCNSPGEIWAKVSGTTLEVDSMTLDCHDFHNFIALVQGDQISASFTKTVAAGGITSVYSGSFTVKRQD